MSILVPREEHPTVFDIDYDTLRERGISGLIFDLDNTLCPWRAQTLKGPVEDLLTRLQAQGFRISILSNGNLNKRGKILEELAQLEIPVIFPARKPLPFGFRRALKLMGTKPGEVAVIGDQVFTDVLGGNLLGIYTVLVSPISPREHPWTKWVGRTLERFLGRRLKQ